MIILDTQHVSQHQIPDSKDHLTINSKLEINPDCWITVITTYEQLREPLGKINRLSKRPEKQRVSYDLLLTLLDYYAEWWPGRILPFDEAASAAYVAFDASLIRRIGDRDARIAAIALAHGARIVTANLADFRQVPGLDVENWLGN